MPLKRVMIGLATTGCLTLQEMSQGNVSQERQLIRVTATSAACTVPPVHSPWTLIAVAGPCSPPLRALLQFTISS
jgi:hypothetical protein